MLKVYLIEDDPDFLEQFLCGAITSDRLRVVGQAASISSVYPDIRETNPDLIIVGLEDGLRFVRELVQEFSIPVLVSAPQPGLELYRRARAEGAKGVLSRPYSVQDVLNAVENILNIQPTTQGQAGFRPRERLSATPAGATIARQEIVAVYSPKGGVGKTTIAASLALAIKKAKSVDLSVCVVDFDTNLSSMATMFFVKPKATYQDWQRYSADDLDRATVESLMVKHESGVFILPAPDQPGSLTDVQAEKIIRVLARYYDVIIIDCGVSLQQDNTIIALEMATKILLVSTPDVAALDKVNSFLQLARKLNIDLSRARLVINRARKDSVPLREISATISIPVAARIPEHPRLVRLVYDGKLPYTGKDEPFSAEVRRLAGTVVPVFKPERRALLAQFVDLPKKLLKKGGGDH